MTARRPAALVAPIGALAALLAGCPGRSAPGPLPAPGPPAAAVPAGGVAAAASTSPAAPTLDPARVRAFFATLGPEQTTLHARDPRAGDAAAAFAWLDQAIGRAQGDAYAYHLARVDGGSGAYALRRAAGERSLVTVAGKAYITVRYAPDGLACPEHHGVIDPDAPALLAFWSEGG